MYKKFIAQNISIFQGEFRITKRISLYSETTKLEPVLYTVRFILYTYYIVLKLHRKCNQLKVRLIITLPAFLGVTFTAKIMTFFVFAEEI